MQWKWRGDSPTPFDDFGLPTSATSYHLCVYDGASTVVMDARIPAGGMCSGASPKPCWRRRPKGFAYRNSDRGPDGIERLKLQGGHSPGTVRIEVKGKGQFLDNPTLPIAQPVTVQLHNDGSGLCWEAVFAAPAIANSAGPPALFKDKAD